ncbi:hypothetical protein ACVMIH_000054 [Bradyrhizobium sp. USDA 4503]
MTTALLKIKVLPKPTIRGKMDVRFPANVAANPFLVVERVGSGYVFRPDFTILDSSAILDPAATLVAVYDIGAGIFKQITLSALIASTTQIDQHITAAGPVPILNNAGIVRVDQAVGAPITLTLPLASAKTCPVLISDWKGDAGTNNITINLAGADKFPGGLTSWTIAGDTGSVFLRPIAGVGYAL